MTYAESIAFDAARILSGPGSIVHRMYYAMMQLRPSDEQPFYGAARETIVEIAELTAGEGTYIDRARRMSETDLRRVGELVVRLCKQTLEQRLEREWEERFRSAGYQRTPYFDNGTRR